MKSTARTSSPRRHRAYSSIEALESRIAPAVIVVTSNLDSPVAGKTDLRQALAMADADLVAHPGVVNTIKFALPVAAAHTENAIVLFGTELTSNGDVNIIGPGAGKLIIDANNHSTIFNFSDPSGSKDSPVAISGLSLIHAKGTGNGGAIYSTDSLSLKSVVISGNTATGNGAALFMQGNTNTGTKLSIGNSLITSNSTTASQGAVCVFNLQSFAMTSTVVSGNSAGSNAGGVYANVVGTGGITITSSVISGNSATGSGGTAGGMVLNDSNSTASKVTISKTTIIGNVSSGTGAPGGGGVLLTAGHAVITGSIIENNTALYDGGGIGTTGGLLSLTITGSTISGNRTTATNAGNQGGGGVFIYGPEVTSLPLTITGSRITDNSAALDGGGIFALHFINLSVVNSSISGNHAGSGFGGGIAAVGNGATNQVNLTVTSSILAGNVAGTDGGAIGTFGNGGAETGNITLISSKLTGNFAGGIGGGMHAATNGAVTMKNDTIMNNFAVNSGGGIAFDHNGNVPQSLVTITGGAISGNSATQGGGLSFNGTKGTILGVTITGNVASSDGGGVGVGVEAFGAVSTLIFKADNLSGNTAPVGPDLDNTDGSTITFT